MTRDEGGAPRAIVLAGPNGAGKTTAAPMLLRDELGLGTYVNADLIAQGLSGFRPEEAAREAGRIMLRRLDALEAQGESFAFESTLSGLGHLRRMRRLRDSGYEVLLFFLWLPSPELAVVRVEMRVRHGGHAIPPEVVRRRFARGLRNFVAHYRPVASAWRVYDGGGRLSEGSGIPLVARGVGDRTTMVADGERWQRISQEAGRVREAPEPPYEHPDPVDRAMTRAFQAAVRLHRMHGIPLVVQVDDEVRRVDPWSIRLPEDSG